MNKDEVPKKQKGRTNEEKTYNNQYKTKKVQTPCFLGHLDPDIVFLIIPTIYRYVFYPFFNNDESSVDLTPFLNLDPFSSFPFLSFTLIHILSFYHDSLGQSIFVVG